MQVLAALQLLGGPCHVTLQRAAPSAEAAETFAASVQPSTLEKRVTDVLVLLLAREGQIRKASF